MNFVVIAVISVIFVVRGLIVQKPNKNVYEPSNVLPLLGLSFAAGAACDLLLGFLEYIINIYIGRKVSIFGFASDTLEIPALFGLLSLAYLAIWGYIKFLGKDAKSSGKKKDGLSK
jgi:hypothetical protein